MATETHALRASTRPLEPGDRRDWERLWRGYLAFYEAEVDPAVFDVTWSRLSSNEAGEFRGLLACGPDGAPLGLAHYLFHRHCWSVADACYLQDLFVAPEARGRGAGRALIEAVYAEADSAGAANVYWLTQDFNHTARQLYDRISVKTPFIKYSRR